MTEIHFKTSSQLLLLQHMHGTVLPSMEQTSIPAIRREFKFPFNFQLQPSPNLTLNHAATIHDYLSKTAANASFTRDILKLLLEECHTAHHERVNSGRIPSTLKINDIVSAHIQVQSDTSRSKVGKLMYKAKGPYKVTATFDNGSYSVQRLGHNSGPLLKFHGSDLFQLPPCLAPCEPLDTPDLRYLNNANSPIPHPLQAALDIQLYNECWFPDQSLPTRPPPNSSILPAVPPCTYEAFPTIADLNQAINLPHPTILDDFDTIHPAINPDIHPTTLPLILQQSIDRLFFIQYCPVDTFRPRWYLVQPLLPSPPISASAPTDTSMMPFIVSFFAKHPTDNPLSDVNSRWWPEWHHYTLNPSDLIIDFGPRILF